MKIHDGINDSARTITTLCGNDLKSPIISTGKQMYVSFYTDGSVQHTGYYAYWKGETGMVVSILYYCYLIISVSPLR